MSSVKKLREYCDLKVHGEPCACQVSKTTQGILRYQGGVKRSVNGGWCKTWFGVNAGWCKAWFGVNGGRCKTWFGVNGGRCKVWFVVNGGRCKTWFGVNDGQ